MARCSLSLSIILPCLHFCFSRKVESDTDGPAFVAFDLEPSDQKEPVTSQQHQLLRQKVYCRLCETSL